MRFSALLAVLLAVLLVSPAFSYEILHSIGHPTFGPDSLTRSNTMGLDFLDLNLSTNLNLSDVKDEMEPGGQFEGFRIAGIYEMLDLIDNEQFREYYYSGSILVSDSIDVAHYTALARMLGLTNSSESGSFSSFGLLAVGRSPLTNYAGGINFAPNYPYASNSDVIFLYGGFNGGFYEHRSPNQGWWLVRPIPAIIPEPTTLTLTVLGLCLVAGRRR